MKLFLHEVEKPTKNGIIYSEDNLIDIINATKHYIVVKATNDRYPDFSIKMSGCNGQVIELCDASGFFGE